MTRGTYADSNGGIVVPRKTGNPKQGRITWQLSIPQSLVRCIPNLDRLHFRPEITDEGILYRPVLMLVEAPPNWSEASNQDRGQP